MLFIGTSGWQYRDWRGAFYPEKLPQRLWLDYYAQRFPTAEVNNTFYRLPERMAFERWAETVPADFRMAAKMSRYLGHIKGLNEPAEPVQRFLDRSAGLDGRLGPVLLGVAAHSPRHPRRPRRDAREVSDVGAGRRRTPARVLVVRRDKDGPRAAQRGAVLGRPEEPNPQPSLAHSRFRIPAPSRRDVSTTDELGNPGDRQLVTPSVGVLRRFV